MLTPPLNPGVALLLVATGGAAGAVGRWLLALALESLLGRTFPWGVLGANLLGCFAYGLLWVLVVERVTDLTPAAKLLVLTGFLGAFTTFSTYAFETLDMLARQRAYGRVFLQLALHNGLGLLLAWFGLLGGRWLTK
jgi:CrcB protein